MLMKSDLRTQCILLQIGFCENNPASGWCHQWHQPPTDPLFQEGLVSWALFSQLSLDVLFGDHSLHHLEGAAAPWVHEGTTGSFLRTPPSCERLQMPHWEQTLPLQLHFFQVIFPSSLFCSSQRQGQNFDEENELSQSLFVILTPKKKKKSQGIMCYHLKREISSKWRSLKVPKVEKTSFVPWSTCSVQSARSTQVITFTTNGASHSDKMFQHYLITKLHYCSTTYWVKQFTCSIQQLSQMRKIYEYASKTAQSLQRRHHPE